MSEELTEFEKNRVAMSAKEEENDKLLCKHLRLQPVQALESIEACVQYGRHNLDKLSKASEGKQSEVAYINYLNTILVAASAYAQICRFAQQKGDGGLTIETPPSPEKNEQVD